MPFSECRNFWRRTVKHLSPTLYQIDNLQELLSPIFGSLSEQESVSAYLSGEHSSFARFNEARIRQTGEIFDQALSLRYQWESPQDKGVREQTWEFSLSGDPKTDRTRIQNVFDSLRKTTPSLPADPYSLRDRSHSESEFTLLEPQNHSSFHQQVSEALELFDGLDAAGLHINGPVTRMLIDSHGKRHTFRSYSHSLDYSIFLDRERCFKGGVGGNTWNPNELAKQVDEKRRQSAALLRPHRKLPAQAYRTYIAPNGVLDLLQTLAWGGLSERSIQKGESPLSLVRRGERTFSDKFSLWEDFSLGLAPRFSEHGELSPERLSLIENGGLISSLVSARSGQEFSIPHNGATASETPRSLCMAPGTLPEAEISQTLEEGLFLSNLHYLNWSDRSGGRITGMTRYACFWVENGEWVAPIEQLRFDETLFKMFGSELLELTDTAQTLPKTDTYDRRSTGGFQVPGILLKSFAFKS